MFFAYSDSPILVTDVRFSDQIIHVSVYLFVITKPVIFKSIFFHAFLLIYAVILLSLKIPTFPYIILQINQYSSECTWYVRLWSLHPSFFSDSCDTAGRIVQQTVFQINLFIFFETFSLCSSCNLFSLTIIYLFFKFN